MTLQGLREERDLSQNELAEKAGINQSTVSKLENGISINFNSQTVGLIATALETDDTVVYEAIQESILEAE